MKINAAWLSASVLTLAWCGNAYAQTPPEDPKPTEAEAEKQADANVVVITAERRETNLQTTPIAASVMTGEDLENRGITSVDQLQFATPAAVVNNFGQGIDFNIRGIGKAEHNTQTTTGVITYRDGVATFPGYFTAEPYYDIARVEVLRGPQGTFVGQNATGGAVFVTSNNPIIDGGYHGYVQGQIGNYQTLGAQGALNLPINDTMAARVAFNADMRESFFDIAGPYSGDDGIKTFSGRFAYLWEPSDDLQILWKTDANYLDLSGYPSDPVNSANDMFEITANADIMARDKFVRTVLNVNYELGDGTVLRSISGYQKGNTQYRADLDGTSTGNSTFRDSVDEVIYSQEFNIISPDTGPFTYILGAYYQHDEYDFLPGEFVIGVPAGVVEYTLEGTNPKETTAFFGQATYDFGNGFEVQGGLRYTDAKTSNDISVNQFGLPLVQQQTAKWSDLSGKLAVNWTVDDHNFLYAFAARGFRPGGLNVPVGLGVPAPFDEEIVKNYEIGWKAGWLDGQVRTQMDVYYNDYENFQVIVGYPQFPTFGFELNVPNATKIYGFEAQLEADFDELTIDAGLGIMTSELGEFWASDPRNPAPTTIIPGVGASVAGLINFFGGCNTDTGLTIPTAFASLAPLVTPYCVNLGGRDQTYAPDLTFNIGAQYQFTLPSGDTITPRINYGHVSEQWATLFQNEARGDRIEQRDVFNAQLSWRSGDIITTLWGSNVTDQRYVGAINSGLRFAGPPRQFGLRVLKIF